MARTGVDERDVADVAAAAESGATGQAPWTGRVGSHRAVASGRHPEMTETPNGDGRELRR